MGRVQQGLHLQPNIQPTTPQTAPSRWTIPRPSQVSPPTGDCQPAGSDRQRFWRHSGLRCDKRHGAGSHTRSRRHLRRPRCQVTHLQHTHLQHSYSHRRHEAQQAAAAFRGVDWPNLTAPSGCETLVIGFNDPAAARPVSPLPGVGICLGLPCWVCSKVSKLPSSAASRAGGGVSHTRTAQSPECQSASGVLLPRGAFQGGSRVTGPKLRWSDACRGRRPWLAGTAKGR